MSCRLSTIRELSVRPNQDKSIIQKPADKSLAVHGASRASLQRLPKPALRRMTTSNIGKCDINSIQPG